ncbi:hypothetical protein OIO90_002584 [Microbotryomycetes sp. JL221]|nr:hypothetical protein OIO90_002584 [Microbotryomycetes sp. JL221]
MVVLQLQPHRGNHARFFPHAGFLGLTPVVIQGTVKVSFQEDHRPIKASTVLVRVRCYEAEVVGGKTRKRTANVIFEQNQEVWTKQSNETWSDLGEVAKPFRITLGVDAGGVSTCTFKNYRTWWQIEAVIYHKPSPVHGSRKIISHQIPLTRYSVSPTPPTPLTWESSKAEASLRGLNYAISMSNSSGIGPDEPINLSCTFHKTDPAVSIRKVQVTVDRRVILDSAHVSPSTSDEDDDASPTVDDTIVDSYTPSPSDDETVVNHIGRSSTRNLSSVFKRATSAGSSSGKTPLSSPQYVPALDPGSYFAASPPSTSASTSNQRTFLSAPLVMVESEDIACDVPNVIVCTFPKAKSIFRYSLGETFRTGVAQVRFVITIRIHLRARNGSQQVIELEPRPVTIIGSSAEERAKALAVSGRVLALADAETRLFDPASDSGVTHDATDATSSALGARRSSAFNLTIDSVRSNSVDSQIPTPPRTDSPAEAQANTSNSLLEPKPCSTRRRSEQSDQPLGAPVRNRARFAAESSSISPPASLKGLNSIPLSSSWPKSPQFVGVHQPTTPSTPDSPVTPTDSSFASAVHGLALPPKRFFALANVPTSAYTTEGSKPVRRVGRSVGPYSTLSRPRSAGQLSVVSQKSTMSTQSHDSLTSTASLRSYGTASSTSTGIGREENGAVLPSSSTATLTLGLDMPHLTLNADESRPAVADGSNIASKAPEITEPPSPALSDASMFSKFSNGVDERPSTAMTTDLEASSCGGDLTEDEGFDHAIPPSTPPKRDLAELTHVSSPAIDFQSFSLAARLPPKDVLDASTQISPTRACTGVDPSVRAQIAPWSVDDEFISPFDTNHHGDRIRHSKHSNSQHPNKTVTTCSSKRSCSMNRANSLESRPHRPNSLSPLSSSSMTTSSTSSRRKSAGGFALFSSSSSSHVSTTTTTNVLTSQLNSSLHHSYHLHQHQSHSQQQQQQQQQSISQSHQQANLVTNEGRWNFLRRSSRA